MLYTFTPIRTCIYHSVCLHACWGPAWLFQFPPPPWSGPLGYPEAGQTLSEEFTASQTLNQGIKLAIWPDHRGQRNNKLLICVYRSIRRPGTYVRISQKPLEIFLPSASIPQLCESAKWSLVHTPSSSSLVRSQTFHMLLPCGYITISYWFSWTRDWDPTPRTVRSELPGYQIIIKFIHV